MGQLLPNPKNVPTSVSEDWETLLGTNAAGNAGKNMISMTNWDGGTLAPSVAAGSIIEIGGSLAYFETEQLPGGIATGVNYLKFTVSGTTVTPIWTLTAPTWDAAKGGWYSGSDRYSGNVCYQSGGAYSRKYIQEQLGLISTLVFYDIQAETTRTLIHGITNGLSRIVSIDGIVEYSGTAYFSFYSPSMAVSAHVIDDTSIRVASSNIANKRIRVELRFIS